MYGIGVVSRYASLIEVCKVVQNLEDAQMWCLHLIVIGFFLGGGNHCYSYEFPYCHLSFAFFFKFCIFLCSIWWTIFIGFAGWLHWDPDRRTLLVYSVSATFKVTAGFPLSSRPGVRSINRLCVVPAGSSTDAADPYSSGGQTVPACSQTHSMYNDQDEIVCNIWNLL
jgi:hypothetical protein